MTARVFVPQVDLHNIDAEQQLLGAILINNQAYSMVSGLIGPEHFFEPIHREIFRLAGELISTSKVATPITLKPLLPPDIKIGDMPIGRYLVELAANSTTIINAPDFARHVFDFWTLRQIAEIGSGSIIGTTPTAALSETWQRLDALRARMLNASTHAGSLGSFARKLVEQMDRPADDQVVPSTGFTDLDKFVGGGWRPERLIVAAGRPGMGKSVFGIASAMRVARRGYGVAFFSLEIDGIEVSARATANTLASSYEPVNYSQILSGELTELQRAKIREVEQRLAALPLHVDTTGGLSMFEIEARTRMLVDRWAKQGIPLGLIVIDYLGLVRPSDRYAGRKVDELGEIAWAGKELAKKQQAAVLMLSQLNRSVEGREDKRPSMSDLRDSGNIEEHADIVALLYRAAYYDDRDPKVREGDIEAIDRAAHRKHDLEIGLGKNRLGPTTSVTLYADVGRCCVDNLQRGPR